MTAKKPGGKRGNRKYTEAQQQEAITIALASSRYQASKKTGIPPGTIANWLFRMQATPESSEAAKEAIAEGKRKAAVIVTKQLSAAAVESFKLGQKAMLRLGELLEAKEGDRDSAAWLRSVSTTFGVTMEKALLLSSHATAAKADEEGRTDGTTQEPIEDAEFIEAVQAAYNEAAKRKAERSNVTSIASRQVAKG